MSNRWQWRRSVAVLAAGLGLAACQSTTEPGPDNGVTSVSVTAPNPTIALGTTMPRTATVSPSTASQGVVWASSNESRATVSSAGLVTAIFPGAVDITATSTADPAKHGSVSLTVTGCVPLAAADVVNGATLAAGTCYRVDAVLTVSGGTLTVPPGGRIEFGPNTGFSITNAGRLNAVGTATQPITFTSIDPAAHWRGVQFVSSAGAANALHYVLLENAGSNGWNGAGSSRAAVYVDGSSVVDIQFSTIKNSGGAGLTALEGAQPTFANNTLDGNPIALWVHPDVVHFLGAPIDFINNDEQFVRVGFGNTDAVTTAQTWPFLGVGYQLQDRTFVRAPLTIAAGVSVLMLTDGSVIVEQGGSLKAIGTDVLPIIFTGMDETRGYWQGIRIATASLENQFDHVRFEFAGSRPWTGNGESRAAVYLDGSSRASIEHSVFAGSGYYGLWVPAEGEIPGFSGNTFVENVRTMIVHPNRASQIAGDNVFDANDESIVRVTFGNTDAVTTPQTWHRLEVPYHVGDRTFVKAGLTIAEGAELEFAQHASLQVTDAGSLKAVGSMTDPVIFRGAQNLVGYWQGIDYNTASVNNVIDYAVFRNAGSSAWFGGANATATINVNTNGTLSLTNTSFFSTGGFAGIVRNGGALSCSSVVDGGFDFWVITNLGGSLQPSLCD
ncbi:MAG: Ig-like domain-containing protein [Gemmatimonadales bacterium]